MPSKKKLKPIAVGTAHTGGNYGSTTPSSELDLELEGTTLLPSDDADLYDQSSSSKLVNFGRLNKKSLLATMFVVLLVAIGGFATSSQQSSPGQLSMMGAAVEGEAVAVDLEGSKKGKGEGKVGKEEKGEDAGEEPAADVEPEHKHHGHAAAEPEPAAEEPEPAAEEPEPAAEEPEHKHEKHDVAEEPAVEEPVVEEHKHHKHEPAAEEPAEEPAAEEPAEPAAEEPAEEPAAEEPAEPAAEEPAEPAAEEPATAKHEHHKHDSDSSEPAAEGPPDDARVTSAPTPTPAAAPTSAPTAAATEQPEQPQDVMSCLEMPSLCQGYMVPAVRDYSNNVTKAALNCLESEGKNVTKSARCLEPAVRLEIDALAKDAEAKTNVFDLMQCAVCFNCIQADTVDEDVLATFNCSDVKPSGNWDGDWQKFVGGGGGGGDAGGGDAGAGAGFDYSKYMKGGAPGGDSGGGFDWEQYVTGGGDAGGSTGGYDWQQWLNGDGGGKKGKKGGDDAAYDWTVWLNPEGSSGAPDWRSFIPAEEKGKDAGFDWQQFIPGF
ncbi:hypothetical protein TeGR_g6142 [Tetraparma gracilis]|uniref:Uncharacterized protein n=1 Tax=Tetraparma gracilis TaxID=2962635 RepID=A0ABQ6MZZ7_9STRA|nr:hypothetical protein TeGR_g6142 [Tetraparma gracilis]